MKCKTYIASLFILLILLVGCDSKDKKDISIQDKESFVDISQEREQIKKEYEEIISTKYSNLTFSDSFYEVSFPDCGESISLLKITEPENALSNDFSLDDYKNKVKKQIDKFFPNEIFNSNFLYCNAEIECENTLYPQVDNYYSSLKDGTLPFTWFMYQTDSDNVYAVWNKSDNVFPYRMSKGLARDLSGSDISLASWLPTDSCEIIKEYNVSQIGDNVEYQLNDGIVNLKSAVNFIETSYLDQINVVSDFEIDVAEVAILKVTENIYGYNFYVRKKYNDVPFDYVKNNTGFSKSSDNKEYSYPIAEIFMIENQSVDTFLGLGIHKPYEIVGEVSKIVPLKQAVQTASELLTQNIVFDVENVELIYSLNYQDDDPRSTSVFARPEWKITARNHNDDYNYVVYIDAETGNPRYQKFITKEN